MSPRKYTNGRQFGEVGRAVTAVLKDHKIRNARWGKTTHAFVEFELNGEEIHFRFACTPRSNGHAARLTRNRLEKLITESGHVE